MTVILKEIHLYCCSTEEIRSTYLEVVQFHDGIVVEVIDIVEKISNGNDGEDNADARRNRSERYQILHEHLKLRTTFIGH